MRDEWKVRAVLDRIDDLNVVMLESLEALERLTGRIDTDVLQNDDASILELALLFQKAKILAGRTSEFKTTLNKSVDKLRLHRIPEQMGEDGVDSLKLTNIGTLYLTDSVNVSIIPGQEENFFTLLDSIGLGDLVQQKVNTRTLAATYLEWLRNGDKPPGTDSMLKISPFTRAAIRKS